MGVESHSSYKMENNWEWELEVKLAYNPYYFEKLGSNPRCKAELSSSFIFMTVWE